MWGVFTSVNVECIHGAVVIGEPKGLNQDRQEMKHGWRRIDLYSQGVERSNPPRDGKQPTFHAEGWAV